MKFESGRHHRRQFLNRSLGFVSGAALSGAITAAPAPAAETKRDFKISLAAWSLHRAFFDNLLQLKDFPAVTRRTFGIEAVELVNTFFPSPQARYLDDLKSQAADAGVEILLIMIDGEGALGHSREKERLQAVRNHFKWVDVAHRLGCHSIRVNMYFDDEPPLSGGRLTTDTLGRVVDSFGRLVEYALPAGISIIIENHGGHSSNADVLVQVMEAVGSPHFGTLPDFGNFPEGMDKYTSIQKMMPYAKAVSAKCHDFDDQTGAETRIDYEKMLEIVVDQAGYQGYIGIEYEGRRLTEYEGIVRCKALLEKYR